MSQSEYSEQRYEYDLKIKNVEREIEELRRQELQLETLLENFNDEITHSFKRLLEIEDESTQKYCEGINSYDTEFRQSHIKQIIKKQYADQAFQFRKATQCLDEEREFLMTERNKLPWD